MLIARRRPTRAWRASSSQIPVVDGYRNMRRVHGTIGFRRCEKLMLDDRAAAGSRPARTAFMPHAAPDPATEVSTWPFPETYDTFKELKAREAPAYENRSTIESAELLMSYDVARSCRASSTPRRWSSSPSATT